MLDSLTHASLKYGLLEVNCPLILMNQFIDILYNPLKAFFIIIYNYLENHM